MWLRLVCWVRFSPHIWFTLLFEPRWLFCSESTILVYWVWICMWIVCTHFHTSNTIQICKHMEIFHCINELNLFFASINSINDRSCFQLNISRISSEMKTPKLETLRWLCALNVYHMRHDHVYFKRNIG